MLSNAKQPLGTLPGPHIDLDQVQRLNGAIEVRLPKYNSERTVHVPDAMLQMLSEHVALGLPYGWLFAEVGDVSPSRCFGEGRTGLKRLQIASDLRKQ